MKRAVRALAVLPIPSFAALIGYALWPKYGLCLKTTRYDAIACVARRGLHFSAHLTWSLKR